MSESAKFARATLWTGSYLNPPTVGCTRRRHVCGVGTAGCMVAPVSFQFPEPGPGPHISPPAGSQKPSRAQEARAQALEGKVTFAVSATVTPRRRRAEASHHRGVLLISPDAIVFIAGRADKLRFEHSEDMITIMRSRLRTYLVLKAKSADVRIRVPAMASRKLRRALRESGTQVVERTS